MEIKFITNKELIKENRIVNGRMHKDYYCPYCGSSDIEKGHIDFICHSCGISDDLNKIIEMYN